VGVSLSQLNYVSRTLSLDKETAFIGVAKIELSKKYKNGGTLKPSLPEIGSGCLRLEVFFYFISTLKNSARQKPKFSEIVVCWKQIFQEVADVHDIYDALAHFKPFLLEST
jgi:hypothetical protein